MSPPAEAPVAAPRGSLARSVQPEVHAFAAEIGDSDPISVVGGRTHWTVGAVDGCPAIQCREVRAPAGVWEHEPAEMTVRCGAGTTVAELNRHLGPSGQMVPLDPADDGATVGGVLACGFSGHRRLRYGHVRDLVLQTRHIDAAGKIVTAGGPTVKNVSGYDLVRLLIGSLGTLGSLAEVILRTLPIPPVSQWLSGPGDPFDAPFDAMARLYRPTSVLWNGSRSWILLEGHGGDVAAQAEQLTPLGFAPVAGCPPIPGPGRQSLRPSDLRGLAGGPACDRERGDWDGGDWERGDWLAEVGVGLVHRAEPAPATAPANAALMEDLKRRLDPTHRLNPARRAW